MRAPVDVGADVVGVEVRVSVGLEPLLVAAPLVPDVTVTRSCRLAESRPANSLTLILTGTALPDLLTSPFSAVLNCCAKGFALLLELDELGIKSASE